MKKILISIKPKWTAKILNGEKTIEVRKTAPKCKLPCEVYIYCTKENAKYFIDNKIYNAMMKGKVVAKFTLNKVEEMERSQFSIRWTKTLHADELYERSRLTPMEMSNYLGVKNGYAWYIDQKSLVIFDKPKELKDFFVRDKKGDIPVKVEELKGSKFMALKRIEHAPQSYCFCEVDE